MDLEEEKLELEKQVNELKAKCDAIEKRETERRAIEEKKHAEEIQFLKRTNQQLKVRHNAIRQNKYFVTEFCVLISSEADLLLLQHPRWSALS